jgi:hypothetical protein
MSEEIEITAGDGDELAEEVCNAVEAASSQDKITWVTDHGQRVAAIVPVDVAEAHEQMIEKVLSTPVGKPKVRFPNVTVCLSVNHSGSTGAIMATVAKAMKEAGCEERDIRTFREGVFGRASYDEVLQFVMRTVNVE